MPGAFATEDERRREVRQGTRGRGGIGTDALAELRRLDIFHAELAQPEAKDEDEEHIGHKHLPHHEGPREVGLRKHVPEPRGSHRGDAKVKEVHDDHPKRVEVLVRL
jgi:hypothetical protein